jgi:hypothetical protein
MKSDERGEAFRVVFTGSCLGTWIAVVVYSFPRPLLFIMPVAARIPRLRSCGNRVPLVRG